jgi:hypothetical protein
MGGDHIALFGDSGYLIFDPARKPVTRTQQEI